MEYDGNNRTTKLLGCLASQVVIERTLKDGRIDMFVSGHNATFGVDFAYTMNPPEGDDMAAALSRQMQKASGLPLVANDPGIESKLAAPGVHIESKWLDVFRIKQAGLDSPGTFLEGMGSLEYVAQENEKRGHAPTFGLAFETALFLINALGNQTPAEFSRQSAHVAVARNIVNYQKIVTDFIDSTHIYREALASDELLSTLLSHANASSTIFRKAAEESLLESVDEPDDNITIAEHAKLSIFELYSLRPYGQVVRAARLLHDKGIINVDEVNQIENPFFQALKRLSELLEITPRTITAAVQAALGSLVVTAAYAHSTARTPNPTDNS